MKPRHYDLTRKRGDTVPVRSLVKDAQGLPVDVTSSSFRLVIDTEANPPTSATNIADVAGLIVNGAGGIVEFLFSAAQADQTPGRYFYEIEMTDATGRIGTLVQGHFVFLQDRAK